MENKMNNIKIEKWKHDRGTRCCDALAKGTLLWGSTYATGASALAYVITPMVSDEKPMYSELFLESLLIFPLCGTVGGYISWRLRNYRPVRPVRHKNRRRRNTIHRLKAYRRRTAMRFRHA